MNDSNEGIDVPMGLTPTERELGMDRNITRRDFLNAAAIGAGASLLGASAPRAGRDANPSAPVATLASVTMHDPMATPGRLRTPGTASATISTLAE